VVYDVSPTRPLIAIVDDDPSVCKALRRLIVASKFDAVTFLSGEIFLRDQAAHRPNCVVLDLHMPGLGGIEVMSALADTGCMSPVIMITGRDDPGTGARCLAAGAHAYLRKPFDPLTLLEWIENALGKSSP
jgi:FixJ family two-component response regulator